MLGSKDLSKRYYSIGEVARMFDVSTSLIRYWEGEFSALRPSKNTKGERRFTPDNILMIERIYHLVKERGFTLEGARLELKAEMNRKRQKEEIIHKLTTLKSRLEQWLEEWPEEEEK